MEANHIALVACDNNIIDFSSFNNALVVHISRDVIKGHLRFLSKDLSQIPLWQRGTSPVMTAACLAPDVFRVATRHSVVDTMSGAEREHTYSPLFAVLSRFLNSKRFISLLMYTLRNCISNSIYHIIKSDIREDWDLSMVTSCLCLNSSLLEKKLKSEDTSYNQIITTCHIRYAANQLLMDNKNISQVSQLCGCNSTSYSVSVFKESYGMTPLCYVSQHKEPSAA